MMSETPMGLLHASLIAKPDATAHPSQQVAKVRMLRDATGQTSHPGPPQIISAKKGEAVEVSGDLALLWFASETAEPWADEPDPEPVADAPAPAAAKPAPEIAPEAQAIRTATEAASVKAAEVVEAVKAAAKKKKSRKGKGKAGDRFARKDPWSEGGA